MNDENFALLSRYIDNDLSSSERTTVEVMLRNNPEFKQNYDQLLVAEAKLKEGLSEIGNDPIPIHLERILAEGYDTTATDNVIQLQPKQIKRHSLWSGAIAASVAMLIGVFVGRVSIDEAGSQQLALEQLLSPSSTLANVLNSVPSGKTQVVTAYKITPELSFTHENGQLCRQFRADSDSNGLSAIACRQANDQWHTLLISANNPVTQSSENYQTASAETPKALVDFVSQNIDGIPFGIDEEAQMLNR